MGENIKLINVHKSLAPVEVADINNKLYVINGHHRVEAAIRTGMEVKYKVLSKEQWQAYEYKTESDIIQAASATSRVKLDNKITKEIVDEK